MIEVKKVDVKSIPVIRELANVTWAAAYASIISANQMKYMLELFYSAGSLQKQIEQENHQFILSMENATPVGFASYAPKTGCYNELVKVYRLHKIYIDPARQGKGIGKYMLDFIINDIRPAGATDLELNVNRYNKALQFYQKSGFTITREEDIDIGNGYFMNDYVMNLSI